MWILQNEKKESGTRNVDDWHKCFFFSQVSLVLSSLCSPVIVRVYTFLRPPSPANICRTCNRLFPFHFTSFLCQFTGVGALPFVSSVPTDSSAVFLAVLRLLWLETWNATLYFQCVLSWPTVMILISLYPLERLDVVTLVHISVPFKPKTH